MAAFQTATLLFLLALGIGYFLTVAVRKIAVRVGLTDRPDGRRKLHDHAIPLGGGVAVFFATVLVLGAVVFVPNRWQQAMQEHLPDLLALLMACGVIVIVGLIDDRFRLPGRVKVVGQLVAALVLVANGLVIKEIGLFGEVFPLHFMAIPFTFFWLFGAINSVNLLDGIDGLATMLGIILVATFAALAAMTDNPEIAVVALVFAGSLCGFMRFNFPPATIFLGDAGSMLIGLVVGALAIQGSLKGAGTVLLAAPLAVWTLPIFDSTAAILRRKLTGRSIYTTDRGHLHHRLLDRLGSNRRVLFSIAVCCALTSSAALFGVYWKSDLVALAVCAALVTIFVATGLFGRAECVLLWTRLRQWARSLLPILRRNQAEVSETAVRLQGSKPWDLLWTTLTDSAERLALSRIHLDLNLPMVHEGFNATWERSSDVENESQWEVSIPLLIGQRSVGRLQIAGAATGEAVSQDLERLLELVEPFEARLRWLAMEENLVGAPITGSSPHSGALLSVSQRAGLD